METRDLLFFKEKQNKTRKKTSKKKKKKAKRDDPLPFLPFHLHRQVTTQSIIPVWPLTKKKRTVFRSIVPFGAGGIGRFPTLVIDLMGFY